MSAAVEKLPVKRVATKLRAVDPKATMPSKPKILIFGKPGVGKTWASLDFPSVYYIDTEGGADLAHYTDKLRAAGGMYLGPNEGSLSFDTLLEQIQALATEKHHFRTVVVDSITKLFMSEIAKEGERLGDKNAFGADKKPAVAYMRRLISWLTRLDMNVILVAHEKAVWGKGSGGQQEVIGETFDAWDKLEYELHLCLNIRKQGTSRIASVRKTRLTGFADGSSFPWSYDEFANRFGREIIEKEAQAIAIASDEQVAEIARLLDTVKMPDGWTEKVLTTAGVASWAEMDAEKIVKAIEFVKEKLP